MAHTHAVIDTDPYFIINPQTRTITDESSTKTVLMLGDHNSSVFGFKMPRYIDSHDMTLCNEVEIHYINIGGSERKADVYLVNDVDVMSDEADTIAFTWLVSRNATSLAGTLSFVIKFKCTENGEVLYKWNTAIYNSIPVQNGIDNSEVINEEYSDILSQWYDAIIRDVTQHSRDAMYEVFSVSPSPDEWFTFILNDTGTGYSVSANFDSTDSEKTNIVIPYEYNGLPVTAISAGGFANNEVIVEIVIPNTVRVIEKKAFQECVNLNKVILPKNIEILSSSLFEGCTSLAHIDLPDTIREIQYDVFRKTGIEYMDLPYGIEYLGETLFSESVIKRVNIPDTVTRFDPSVFYGCSNLEEIIIPNSVTEMGYNQFTSCSNLKRVVVGTGITKISSMAFGYCNNLETVIIPKNVTSIGEDDFWNTSYVPNPNVTLYVEQGSYAEEYAKQYKMKYVYCSIAELTEDAINQLINITTKVYNASYYEEVGVSPSPNEWFTFTLNTEGTGYSVKANFDSTDMEKSNIVIPYEYNGLPVVSIPTEGFVNKENIINVVIPNTITFIGAKAFRSCINLQKVVLPKNIEILTDSMFYGCTNLTYIDLPKSIREIQKDVFRQTSIEYMDLPYGITYIGETLFSESAIKRVNIPDTVRSIGARAFYKCTNLEEIVIPNSVVVLSYNTFTSCKNLKRAVIGTGLATLTASDFMYCDNLETVIIPKTITSMSKDTFWNTSYKPNPNVTLYVEHGSYAEEYARQYQMKYVYSDIDEEFISVKTESALMRKEDIANRLLGPNDSLLSSMSTYPSMVVMKYYIDKAISDFKQEYEVDDLSAYLKKNDFDTYFDEALFGAKPGFIALGPVEDPSSELGVAPSLSVMMYYINQAISEFAQKNGLEV